MGEIGFSRREFLHDLKWWEVKSIIRGYNNRKRDLWSSTRWQTYNLMCAFAGSKSLSESGINSPTDLIKFPWDTNNLPITFDDVQTIVAEIEAVNAQRHQPTAPVDSSAVQQESSEP